jgi:hypothetical protein
MDQKFHQPFKLLVMPLSDHVQEIITHKKDLSTHHLETNEYQPIITKAFRSKFVTLNWHCIPIFPLKA